MRHAPSANIWSIGIPEEGIASIADAKQVTFGNEKIEKLAISADGRWLAYDSDRNGYADIWKQPLGGGPAEQVTRGPNHKFVNDWSPDGREIVFPSGTVASVMSSSYRRTAPIRRSWRAAPRRNNTRGGAPTGTRSSSMLRFETSGSRIPGRRTS